MISLLSIVKTTICFGAGGNVTTTTTTTVTTGMLVFGQGWSVLIIPILLFAGLVVLIALGKKRR